ncbi:hypothetical protein GCM10020295_24060 [Streptomyces cinereospinus]
MPVSTASDQPGRAGREERVVAGVRPQEPGAEGEPGGRHDRRGQRGPGQVPFGVGSRQSGGVSGGQGGGAAAVQHDGPAGAVVPRRRAARPAGPG